MHQMWRELLPGSEAVQTLDFLRSKTLELHEQFLRPIGHDIPGLPESWLDQVVKYRLGNFRDGIVPGQVNSPLSVEEVPPSTLEEHEGRVFPPEQLTNVLLVWWRHERSLGGSRSG